MRIAFFSPLPPARSGIADYSETLLAHLRPLAEITVFSGDQPVPSPTEFDIGLFQVGNNDWHAQAYDTAIEWAAAARPGIVVMHEANLHHLIAEKTIKRGDWDGYLRELAYDGGPDALNYGQRVKALEVGPDYEGVPMIRRILQAAAGVIVHSGFMAAEMRRAGYDGPLAVIPHGAWVPQADRPGFRERLGVDETSPLIGAFGYLKPYKRIPEALRAMRRLVRVDSRVKMILVGEEHPDFPVRSLIDSLGLAAHVRVIGFAPIDDFVGYMSACDIVLNLRYPTVGESSGSLLRALGLGRAVLVSDLGSFAEFPPEICLKVPVGNGEEDCIFEYLSLLTSRPEVAGAFGARAQEWVKRECNWNLVARRYLAFVEAVHQGSIGKDEIWRDATAPVISEPAAVAGTESPAPVEDASEYIRGWALDAPAKSYTETHITRFVKTLAITPPGGPHERVLEMGAYFQITAALRTKLGYGEVRGCYYGPAGKVEHRTVVSEQGEEFSCEVDLFDAEKDRYPYPDEHFDTVLCCELIEHLYFDPMHLMSEVNRILKPGGHFVVTTPNIASLRALSAILQRYHPGFFHAYLKPSADGTVDARHNREYTPGEIQHLLENSGFTVTLLDTGPFREEPTAEYGWVLHLLDRYNLATDLRGDGIYAVGKKTGRVAERYPEWLYS